MSWLDEIRERAEKATPGPWYTKKTGKNYNGFSLECLIATTSTYSTGNNIYAAPPGGSHPANDQDFIAHAREDVPKLIAYIDKLHEAVDYFAVNKCPPNGDCIPVEVDCSECVKRYLNELAEEAINDGCERMQTPGA